MSDDQLDDLAKRRVKRERYQELLDRAYALQVDHERLRLRLVEIGMPAAALELGDGLRALQWLIRALNERLEIS